MRLTLVIPPFDQKKTFGGGVFNRGMLPPLGVGYLAAYIRPRGHKVVLIDSPLYDYDCAGAADAIMRSKPDIVGMSVLTKCAHSAYALAKALKQKDKSLPIVFGGAHVTSFFENIFNECPDVDYLIPGEGEESLEELLDRLEEKQEVGDIKGLLVRLSDGTSIATAPRIPVKDLDTLPSPVRDIYDNHLYVPLPNQNRRLPATTVITSRGCPYGKCRFCYQGGCYSSPYRRRSPENVVSEIGNLVQTLKVKEIIFWDDNFCVNYNWIELFCDLLDEKQLDIGWTVQGRVNTVSEKMLMRMAASGCYNIYYGLESGSQEMLDFVQKGITLEQSRNAVKWAKRAGMEIRGSVIFAMPSDTPEISEQTIRFACELNVDWMIFYPYHVQPGTFLGEIASDYGTILEEQADMSIPSYVPKAYIDAEQISQLIKKANRRYYLRPRYILRTLWRIKNPYTLKSTIIAFIYWLSLVTKRIDKKNT